MSWKAETESLSDSPRAPSSSLNSILKPDLHSTVNLEKDEGSDDTDKPLFTPLLRLSDTISSIPSRILTPFRGERLNSGSYVEMGEVSNTEESSRTNGPMKGFSCGTITFKGLEDGNMTKGKFMNVNSAESADIILDTFISDWHLKAPKLVISILGGEESDDVLTSDVKRELCKGLVETVLSTDVWLFTNGLQRGLIKSLGEALTQHATGRAIKTHRDVVAVGVTPLDILQHKEKLRSQKEEVKKCRDGNTCIEEEVSRSVELDYSEHDSEKVFLLEPNHTHFILVGDEPQEWGVETNVMSRIVNKIAAEESDGIADDQAAIPVVYLLFGGDPTIFEPLLGAVRNNIPVIVFPETKGAAEILARSVHHKGVEKLLRKLHLFGGDAAESRALIQEILKHRHLINVFQGDTVEVNGAVLQAILGAKQTETPNLWTPGSLSSAESDIESMANSAQHSVIKNRSRVGSVSSMKGIDDSLHLAVLWNRIDVAKSYFDKTSKIWQKTEAVEKLLYRALVNDQHEFVKFFIEAGGIDMKELLHSENLKKLYNEMSDRPITFDLLCQNTAKRGSERINLVDVETLLKALIFDTYDPEYTAGKRTYKDPLKELFLWAVLQDRIPMAKLLWKLEKPSIGGALVATKLLKAMSKLQLVKDAQKAANMMEHSKKFEQMATDMLNVCYAEDRRRTSDLLVRIMPEWGGATCLEIAAAASSKHFISQAPVQNLLSELWMGRLFLMTHALKIALCVMLLFLSVWLITFTTKDDRSVSLIRRKRRKRLSSSDGTIKKRWSSRGQGDSTITRERRRRLSQVDHLPYWYKLKLFLEAPVVCFSYNMISHLMFLALFSYIVLANFTNDVSGCEMLLMVWVFTIFTEEIRQFLQDEYRSVFQRFSAWFWGYWNCVDLVSLVMFAIGVGLRFHPATLDAARIVLALDLMVFYFRILHICSASKLLGPKLIMIAKMFLDLLSFVCILMVFLIAYGVACQAILYPNSQEPENIAKGVFYRSYFQLYGELFLDNFSHQVDCAVNGTQLAEGMDPCPHQSWFATVSLAFYLFISNILLLNLLIAMLNYTFTAVQENTDNYWKFQRYQLIWEYYHRPAVVPPFIVVVHVFQLIRYVWDRHYPNNKMYRAPNLMKRKMDHKAMELSAWETVKGQDYLATKKAEGNRGLLKRMQKLEKKLDEMFAEKQRQSLENSLGTFASDPFSRRRSSDTLDELSSII